MRRRLESAHDALDLILLSASDPPEHQTIVLLGKPEGGGVSVIIDGDVPCDELASTVGMLAGVAGADAPLVVATITPDAPTLDEDELAEWHELDDAVSAHGAVLCEWFLVGAGTAIAVGEWSGVEPRWQLPLEPGEISGSRASASRRRRASTRAFRPRR